VAYLPLFICGPDLNAGRLESLLVEHVEPSGGVYAVYPPTTHPPAKVRAFVDLAVERFTPTPPWERCPNGDKPEPVEPVESIEVMR
jgi:DNA-binding transcriptional LysR family regulator